ncbi:hypothetical protein TrRE_jg10817, partial [Triparma retinervis]
RPSPTSVVSVGQSRSRAVSIQEPPFGVSLTDLSKGLRALKERLEALQDECNNIGGVVELMNGQVEAMQRVENFAPKDEAPKGSKRKCLDYGDDDDDDDDEEMA